MKTNQFRCSNIPNQLTFLFMLFLVLVPGIMGQCPKTVVKRALLVKTVVDATNVNSVQINLEVPLFTSTPNQPIRIPKQQVLVVTKPSNTTFTGDQLGFVTSPVPPGASYITIGFPGALPEDDTEVDVIFSNLEFDCEKNKTPIRISSFTASGKIYSKNNIDELVKESKKELEDAVAAAKTSNEKDIFAGFAAAKGEGGKTAGTGDISINRTVYSSDFTQATFFDKATVSLNIKKSTAEKADLKHFTTGLTFRKTFLVEKRKTFNELRQGIQQRSLNSLSSATTENNLTRLRNKGFFRVFLIDETLNLEGEAFDFDSVNFVSDTKFQLASIAKAVGKSRRGYYNLRLLAGPELGRNLQKPEAATTMGATQAQLDKVDWIARLKAGGFLTFRYLPENNSGDKWGIELDLQFVNRYLFSDEVIIKNEAQNMASNAMMTQKFINVSKGNRAYGQADLKVFPFSDGKARYGFKLSYINGSLPPAFTSTKAFTFGLVIETSDDKTSGSTVNK